MIQPVCDESAIKHEQTKPNRTNNKLFQWLLIQVQNRSLWMYN